VERGGGELSGVELVSGDAEGEDSCCGEARDVTVGSLAVI